MQDNIHSRPQLLLYYVSQNGQERSKLQSLTVLRYQLLTFQISSTTSFIILIIVHSAILQEGKNQLAPNLSIYNYHLFLAML